MTLKSLLLIEDDTRFRGKLSALLEKKGFRVTAVASAHDAKEAATNATFDFVVMDLRLPGVSGLSLLSVMVAMQPAAAIVMLTGYGSISTAKEAIKLGAKDYLVKPIEVDSLVSALSGAGEVSQAAEGSGPPLLTLSQLEWEHIERVVIACNGNITQAAKLLGIPRRTLQRKREKFPQLSR